MNLLQRYFWKPSVPRTFIAKCCQRMHSSITPKICGLTHRGVIEVNGKDSSQLLQGLITNNINSLDENNPSMYAMLLNDKGRIVHDLLVYRGLDPDNQFFIECDASEDQNLIDLLKRYKLRKKVALRRRPDLNMCFMFHSGTDSNELLKSEVKLSENERIFKDPRLTQLGTRVLTESSDCWLQRNQEAFDLVSLDYYTKLRYTQGIGEGNSEVGGGIPLEHNLEWLNGVAFDKGCYIGQELVARVHFTGQVRKRVMPIQFDKPAEPGTNIQNLKGRKVGRVLAWSSLSEQSESSSEADYNVGIGVVNVEQGTSEGNTCFSTTQLQLGGDAVVKVVVRTPKWWPQI